MCEAVSLSLWDEVRDRYCGVPGGAVAVRKAYTCQAASSLCLPWEVQGGSLVHS